MAITYNPWDSATLLGSFAEEKPVQNYFTDLLFGRQVQSNDEYIDLEKVTRSRRLAPFVLPMAKGKPTLGRAQRVSRFTPGYIKMLDPILPTRMLKRQPGALLSGANLTPLQRSAAITQDIISDHRFRWERTKEWMAAQAALYGTYTLVGEDYPETLVDFDRAAGHTIILGSGDRWGETDVDPIANVEEWATTMALAEFGGAPTRMTCGPLAYQALRTSASVRQLLDTSIRGANSTLAIGYTGAQNGVSYKGDLGPGLPVWVNAETYVNEAGSTVPFMDPRDILLTSPGFDGVQAFGAILDMDSLLPQPVFVKSYDEPNPSVRNILTQSSPLLIPVNPNNSFRVRVVA